MEAQKNEDGLTFGDLKLLNELAAEAAKKYGEEQKLWLLEKAMLYLGADYAVAATGQSSGLDYAILEYYSVPEYWPTPKEKERLRQWRKTGIEEMITDAGSRIFVAAGKSGVCSTVSLQDLADKLKHGELPEETATAMRLYLANTHQKLAELDRGDSLFSLYQDPVRTSSDAVFGSGLGIHRLKGRPAFDIKEKRLLEAICNQVPEIHTIGVSKGVNVANALKKKPQCKMLFPLIMAGWTPKQMARLFAKKETTVTKQIAEIASAILGKDTTEKGMAAIRERMRIRVVPSISATDEDAGR